MRIIKLIFFLVVVGVLALFMYQNQEYFFTKISLMINFYMPGAEYQAPEIPTILILAVSFVIGFLLSYILTMFGRFKSKRTIKNLNAKINSHLDTISKLKSEVESMKYGSPEVASIPAPVTVDP